MIEMSMKFWKFRLQFKGRIFMFHSVDFVIIEKVFLAANFSIFLATKLKNGFTTTKIQIFDWKKSGIFNSRSDIFAGQFLKNFTNKSQKWKKNQKLINVGWQKLQLEKDP